MKYLMISILWLFSTFAYSVVTGIYLEIGVVVLFCGLVLGISGAAFQTLHFILKCKIKWYYIGLAISILSVLITVLFIGDETKNVYILKYLWVFFVVPSYVFYLSIGGILHYFYKINYKKQNTSIE